MGSPAPEKVVVAAKSSHIKIDLTRLFFFKMFLPKFPPSTFKGCNEVLPSSIYLHDQVQSVSSRVELLVSVDRSERSGPWLLLSGTS